MGVKVCVSVGEGVGVEVAARALTCGVPVSVGAGSRAVVGTQAVNSSNVRRKVIRRTGCQFICYSLPKIRGQENLLNSYSSFL